MAEAIHVPAHLVPLWSPQAKQLCQFQAQLSLGQSCHRQKSLGSMCAGSLRSCPALCDPVEAMAPHSSTLAWKIPWTEEPCRLQSMGSLRVGHTEWLHFHFSLSCTGEGNGNPLQYSCLENPRDGGAWQAAVYGVAQSRTRLKRLRSSSSSRLWPASLLCQGGSPGKNTGAYWPILVAIPF